MLDSFNENLSSAISKYCGIDLQMARSLLEKPRNLSHGDLAFPCFLVAKEKKQSPQECASALAEGIELPESFESAVALGPFVNFKYRSSSLAHTVISDTISFKNIQSRSPQKVVIDYSSPNIAKPFHVGHLRATLIGNCLDRVYRCLGHSTVSINHLGDWGTQFGFVWAGCTLWGEPENPSVSDLVDIYREATKLKEQQENDQVEFQFEGLPDINEIARKYFVDLEDGDPTARAFWQKCVDVSLVYLKTTYSRLDVSFDHYTGESFYADKVEGVQSELKKAELLQESKGAIGVDLGEELGFARITTPDGRSLYLARDLAAAEYRAKEFDFDKALYVVGAPQSLHFQQIIGVLKALGKTYAESIIHVAFGHVLGMKTRGSGTFIELNEFLDEAFEKSLNAYHKQVAKRPEGLDEKEVAEAVARAAIIFSNLSKTNIKDVHFSWDHALEFQGDSGPYLLYACARVSGIEQKAITSGIDVGALESKGCDYSLLTEESAHALLLTLANFYSVLERTSDENEPSYLASYALDVAKAFSKAYLDLKVIGVEQDLAEVRLQLFLSTRKVLSTCLELLGMKTLERM